jgi:hypothetical protein
MPSPIRIRATAPPTAIPMIAPVESADEEDGVVERQDVPEIVVLGLH